MVNSYKEKNFFAIKIELSHLYQYVKNTIKNKDLF